MQIQSASILQTAIAFSNNPDKEKRNSKIVVTALRHPLVPFGLRTEMLVCEFATVLITLTVLEQTLLAHLCTQATMWARHACSRAVHERISHRATRAESKDFMTACVIVRRFYFFCSQGTFVVVGIVATGQCWCWISSSVSDRMEDGVILFRGHGDRRPMGAKVWKRWSFFLKCPRVNIRSTPVNRLPLGGHEDRKRMLTQIWQHKSRWQRQTCETEGSASSYLGSRLRFADKRVDAKANMAGAVQHFSFT